MVLQYNIDAQYTISMSIRWRQRTHGGQSAVFFNGGVKGERVGNRKRTLQKCFVFRLGMLRQGDCIVDCPKKKNRFDSISQRFRKSTHTLLRVSFFLSSAVESEKIFLQQASSGLVTGFRGGGGTCRRRGCCYCRRCRRFCCRYGCCCSDGRLFSEQLGLVFYAPPRVHNGARVPDTIDPS